MERKTNNTSIRVAIIGAVGIIIAAIITTTAPIVCGKKDSGLISTVKHEYVVAGVVVDELTNQSIGQADVSIVGRNEHYVTENNGNFRFMIRDSLEQIRIRVVKQNYKPYGEAYNIPNEDITVQLTEEKTK